ncbi:hypothetical protein BKA82DRAFT_2462301 [Pisolithus tinctorius]|nr:hypothetical protein BKA82DRAFT_2462301 [Pisolithus tinctorius]
MWVQFFNALWSLFLFFLLCVSQDVSCHNSFQILSEFNLFSECMVLTHILHSSIAQMFYSWWCVSLLLFFLLAAHKLLNCSNPSYMKAFPSPSLCCPHQGSLA